MTKRLVAQAKQRFASEILWHFVGRRHKESPEESYKILLCILKDGLKVGHENVEFKYLDKEMGKLVTLWGYPVSCLADIPLKDLPIHAERYGTFAIGFHKEKAIENNFNPVLYINTYSFLFHRFMKFRSELEVYLDKVDKDKSQKFQEMLLTLGSLAKSGDLKANPIDSLPLDEFQLNNFYYEREWRSVYMWEFDKNDVATIIVPDDKAIPLREHIISHDLRVDEHTIILPFSMVYRL